MSWFAPIYRYECIEEIGSGGADGFILHRKWKSDDWSLATELAGLPSITDIEGVPVADIINTCVGIFPYSIAQGAQYPLCSDNSQIFTVPQDAWIHEEYLADEVAAEISGTQYVIIQGWEAEYRYSPDANPLWTPGLGGKQANKYIYPSDTREMQAVQGWPGFDPITQYPLQWINVGVRQGTSGSYTYSTDPAPFGPLLCPDSKALYDVISWTDQGQALLDATAYDVWYNAGILPYNVHYNCLQSVGFNVRSTTQSGNIYIDVEVYKLEDDADGPPGFFLPKYGFPDGDFCLPFIFGRGAASEDLLEMFFGVRIAKDVGGVSGWQ